MTAERDDRRFWGPMLRLAFPIALQNLLISSLHLVDTAMVIGLGNVSVAAIGVASRWIFFMSLMFFGFCSGSASFVAQYWGVGDVDGIRRTHGLALANVLGLAVVYVVLALLVPGPMMRLYTDEAAVARAGMSYIRITAPGMLAMAYANLVGSTLRATERPWLPFVTSGIAVVFDTLLSYCLIYGRLGLPRMGLEGAATATALSLWLNAVLVGVLARTRGTVLAAPLRTLTRWSRAFAARFYQVALPVVGNEVLWAAGTNIYSMVLARQGNENYAAYTICASVEQLTFVFFIGVCSACAIMVGKATGSGRTDLAWRWSGRFLWIMPGMGVVLGGLLIALRSPLVGLFAIETAYTRQTTAALMLLYGLWMPVRMIPYVAVVGIFRGGGDTRTGFLIDSVNVFLLGVPVTCLLGLVWRVPFPALVLGMYVAEDTVKTLMCLLHYRSGKWLRRLTAGRRASETYPEGGEIIGESGISC